MPAPNRFEFVIDADGKLIVRLDGQDVGRLLRALVVRVEAGKLPQIEMDLVIAAGKGMRN